MYLRVTSICNCSSACWYSNQWLVKNGASFKVSSLEVDFVVCSLMLLRPGRI